VKKRNILLIVAIFLALLVVAGGGYLVYNKILKKEDKTVTEKDTNRNDEKEEQAVALDTDSELVKNLLSEVKLFFCLEDYFYEEAHKDITLENMELERKYAYAIQRLKNVNILPITGKYNDDVEHWQFEVTESDMEKALQSALGKNAILEKKTIKGEFIAASIDDKGNKKLGFISDIIYNDSKKTFTIEMYEAQGCMVGPKAIKVTSASKKGKVVTITEKAMFLDYSKTVDTEYAVYSDLEYTKEIGTVNISEFENNSDVTNKYLEKAMTVTYTFEENEDGSYHFVSSKMIN